MPDPQLQALHAYTLLTALRPARSDGWPGSLILSLGLAPEACSIPFAALVAGAACLAIAPDPAICRAAMRTGACDFIVNTVDEALRILKNEIRQHKPISVGVESPIDPALDELRTRGVLPQLFIDPTHSHLPLGPPLSDPSAGEALALNEGWTLQSFPDQTSASLRIFDTRLQSLIPPSDPPPVPLAQNRAPPVPPRPHPPHPPDPVGVRSACERLTRRPSELCSLSGELLGVGALRTSVISRAHVTGQTQEPAPVAPLDHHHK